MKRGVGFSVAIVVGALLGGAIAFQFAKARAADAQAASEQQLRREMGLMLTAIVDLDELVGDGKTELAAWKLGSLRENIEGYVRSGANSPEQFVPDIVATRDVP